MRTASFTHDGKGWSVTVFPEMDSLDTVVLVFGARRFGGLMDRVQELWATYALARFLGCSSAGEIVGATILDDHLTVAVVRMEHTRVESAAQPAAADPRRAALELARTLSRPDLVAVMVLSDGLAVNGSELVRGLNDGLPASVVVTGGLAGDGDRFEATWVLSRTQLGAGHIAAVGFYGERVHLGHGSRGGWDIFGPERVVTRAEGNVLYELDGQPALELYKRYLGERASGLPATALLFPIGVRQETDSEKVLVRTVLSIDEAQQSMTFAGDIPPQSMVRLMRASFDRLIHGAASAGRLATARTDGAPVLAVGISCVGRRIVLGDRAEEELDAVMDSLPQGSSLVGFYSYGEISPYAYGPCDLHNQTMTLTTLSES